MTEHKFISKVHRLLPKEIYKWKINDPYHGGVPDCFYSGPNGFCFMEYKYKDKLPVRSTTPIKFNLSKQQRDWLTKQHTFGLPVYAIMGIGNQVLVTKEFDKESFSVQEFEEKAVHVKEFVHIISNICLNKGT
tara:strand:- start:1351 stop:1749 length:399 start_codon:yes stop_codon:yes gene_type:complete